MPLIPVGMIGQFSSIFQSYPPTPADTASRMANAYHAYAMAAIAVTAVPCNMTSPPSTAPLIPLLVQAMAPSAATGNLERAWASGLPLYWASAIFVGPPIVVFGPPTISVGFVFPAAAGQLLGALTAPQSNAAISATNLGKALHAATIGGTVLFGTAPPGKLV